MYGSSWLVHVWKFVTSSCMEFGDPSDMTREPPTRLRIAFTCGVRDLFGYGVWRVIWYTTRELPRRWRLAFALGVRDAFRNGVRDSFTCEVLKIIRVELLSVQRGCGSHSHMEFVTHSCMELETDSFETHSYRSKLIHTWLASVQQDNPPSFFSHATHHRVSQIQNNNLEATKAQ